MADILDVSKIGDKVSNVGQQALSITGMIVVLLIALGLSIGLLLLIRYIRRYRYPVTIYDYTTNPPCILHDKGGIIKDKITKQTLFSLRAYKIGLSAAYIPFSKSEKGKEVYLIRTGQREYRYLSMPPEISEAEKLNMRNSIGEEDVTNAMNQFTRNLKLRNTSLMSQLMMYAPIILMCGMFLVILIITFKFAPDFMKESKALAAANKEMVEAIKSAYQAQCGTTVIPVN